MWLDLAFKSFTLGSAIIATLRAGSRVMYIMEHDVIGIMDGPLILKSKTNETNLMFELSEAFRHCVRLSYTPQYYEDAKFGVPVKDLTVAQRDNPEPYLMSNYGIVQSTHKSKALIPSIVKEEENEEEDDDDDNDNDNEQEESDASSINQQIISTEDSSPSFLTRQLTRARKAANVIPSSFRYSTKQISKTTQTVSYMARRAWYWRSWNKDKRDVELDEMDSSDWDYNLAIEAELRFTSREGKPRIAELSVFAPDCFSDLRSSFGVSEEEFRKSIFGSGPFVSFQSNSKGAARVGGIFFFTRDGAYMIKTIKKEEAKALLKMLPKYHRHMKRHARSSLLTRFCGMYATRIYDIDSPGDDRGDVQIFTVMNSVFPAEGSTFISERYDLKGSTVGREVSEEELQSKGRHAVLKDMDLAREVDIVKMTAAQQRRQHQPDALVSASSSYGFSIGATRKAALLSQLRDDVKLLVECQVMDYSLLVGVVNMEGHNKIDTSARKAVSAMQRQGRKIATSQRLDDKILYALGAPLRLVISPATFLGKSMWSASARVFSSIVTLPMPYYGSGKCGVDGGLQSVIHGYRRGDRSVYYLGLIDFLQPWTTRKKMERKLKGILGYDTNAISCISPEEYASRFLEFLDAHIS